MKRYVIQAKRKMSEDWCEWTLADTYSQAEKHACYIEELGYSARIIVREKGFEELWDIIDAHQGTQEIADAIFDAGYCKRSEIVREIFAELRSECFDRLGCFSWWKFESIEKKYTEVQDE